MIPWGSADWLGKHWAGMLFRKSTHWVVTLKPLSISDSVLFFTLGFTFRLRLEN